MKLPNFSFEKKLWRKGFRLIAGVDEVGRGCFAGPVVTGCVVFKDGSKSKNGRAFTTFSTCSTFTTPVYINDSKKLTPKKLELAEIWIKKNALAWGVGQASVSEINRLGIGKATKMAFRRAIVVANKRLRLGRHPASGKTISKAMPVRLWWNSRGVEQLAVDFLLIDAFYIPHIQGIRQPSKNLRKHEHAVTLLYNSETKRAGKQLAIVHGDEKSMSIAAASIIAKVYRDKLMNSLSKQTKYKKYGWENNKGYGTRKHQVAIKKYGMTRLHRKQFVKTFLAKHDADIISVY